MFTRRRDVYLLMIFLLAAVVRTSYANSDSTDLSWMRAYVGKSATDLIGDPRFDHDVSYYVLNINLLSDGIYMRFVEQLREIAVHCGPSSASIPSIGDRKKSVRASALTDSEPIQEFLCAYLPLFGLS
jgi:hypothetical protein